MKRQRARALDDVYEECMLRVATDAQLAGNAVAAQAEYQARDRLLYEYLCAQKGAVTS